MSQDEKLVMLHNAITDLKNEIKAISHVLAEQQLLMGSVQGRVLALEKSMSDVTEKQDIYGMESLRYVPK